MNFNSKRIGDDLLDKFARAAKVQVASAFFYPDNSLLDALKAVPRVEMIVSEEFTINDPYKLEQLSKADVRSIPPDHADGKLHAKVFIVTLRDGSQWVLLGSANLTQQGLFANQEACVDLHSASTAGSPQIAQMVTRSHLMLTRFANELRHHKDWIDVVGEYQNATGLTLEQNEAMIFGPMRDTARIYPKHYTESPGHCH
jgi:phosphatidylserine/phosphatidylglycerophosphate/cardiolipin synthase-like enzyme